MNDGEAKKLDEFFAGELSVKNLTSANDPWQDGASSIHAEERGAGRQIPPATSNSDVHINTISSQTLPTLQNGNCATSNRKKKNFLLAACYVDDAVQGRTLKYNIDETSLHLYKTYSNAYLQYFTIAVMWFLLLIALFEEPAVPGAEIPYWGTMLMEVFCLSFIVYRLKQIWGFVNRMDFLHDPKNVVVLCCVLFTVIDMVVYIGTKCSSGSGIRVSRPIRPLFLVNMNESKQVRRAFRNIRNTVKDIINVLVLFIFSIALFTLLAFKLFQHRGLVDRDGVSYFTDYFESLFSLYILVTTANSPDIMMPAYDSSAWFTVFFIIYIIVNTYIFMNLFLAVIYNSYRSNLKKEIKVSVYWKNKQLEMAFDLLHDVDQRFQTKNFVSFETWLTLMGLISEPPSKKLVGLYWEVLKTSVTQGLNAEQRSVEGIEKKQFLQVSNLLNVCVREKKPQKNWFYQLFPTFYMSKPSRLIKKTVRSWYFVRLFDLLILVNAVCIGLDLESTEWFFLAMFMIEISLRVYSVGPREYFQWVKKWNLFDFFIIVAAFAAQIAESVLNDLNEQGEEVFPQEVLDFLMVLRCLRVLRIIASYKQFRIVVMTILNILPSMLTYGAVLLSVYYFYAMIGMEAFAGKITFTQGDPGTDNFCGNVELDSSEFVRIGYCNNNFNDLLHSFVLLVELTVVNQWHIITLGYSLVTSKWARIYFISFHMIVVLLIMNIIVAFVLEAFILEYSVSKSAMESAVEKTIRKLGLQANSNNLGYIHDRTVLVQEEDSDDDGVNDSAVENYQENATRNQNTTGPTHFFKLGGGHKNIETLLQRMFEEEIEKEVFENIDPISVTFNNRKTTTDSTAEC